VIIGKLMSLLIIIFQLLINYVSASDNPIFSLQGNDKIEMILEKIGAPKNSTLPFVFKTGEKEIEITETKGTDRIISMKFTPVIDFEIIEIARFEKVEVKNTGDLINQNIMIAIPQKGQIWTLTNELKAFELDLVKPWIAKNKLMTIKEIIGERSVHKIKKVEKHK
jgi:hypothetical protein